MNPDSHNGPDEFQQAWQAHTSRTRITVDADLLHQEVLRSQKDFQATVRNRDFGEIAVVILMLPLWLYLGITMSLPWTWYLMVPVSIWMGGFMLIYRLRHKQEPSSPDESLVRCVKRSLVEQEDQIWLLRNVFWWYLLPPGAVILAFFAQISWSFRSSGWMFALIFFLFLSAFVISLYYYIYWLNQRCVRTQLEPRRKELLKLIASLRDETAGEV